MTLLIALFGMVAWSYPMLLIAPIAHAPEPVELPGPRDAHQEGSEDENEAIARVLIVGDLLYDRSVRTAADAKGDDFIFSCLADSFAQYDLVIANLENPVTDNPSVSVGTTPASPNNYRFTAPVRVADVLARHNIRAVTIGNNHVRDQGDEGIAQTRATLLSSQILAVGDPTDRRNTAATFRVNDVPITLVSYNEFFGSQAWSLAAIASSSAERITIVMPHWGDEYATTSAPRQQTLARQFVDAGADLIVGTHPHVIQEHTTYKDVPIYYSIGNFIFDNYDNYDVTHGIALEVIMTHEGIQNITEHPIVLTRDRRTCFTQEAGD